MRCERQSLPRSRNNKSTLWSGWCNMAYKCPQSVQNQFGESLLWLNTYFYILPSREFSKVPWSLQINLISPPRRDKRKVSYFIGGGGCCAASAPDVFTVRPKSSHTTIDNNNSFQSNIWISNWKENLWVLGSSGGGEM